MEIYIWQLERMEKLHADEINKCIVAAASEKEARQVANSESEAEGYVWTDGNLANCIQIGLANDGISGLLLASKD
jgi:hypothetical protein